MRIAELTSDNPGSLTDADVVLVKPRYGAVLRSALPAMKNVRWIHALGAGVETLPFDLLRQRPEIVVTNSKGIYADALAEFVIAAILWFAKDLRRLYKNQEAHQWEPYTVERIEGATVGVFGFGGVGRAVAKR
ncbi:MAG TPA: NAD(P)-dependent oxidoreductase, partial [Rhodanobacteraceae bacterium]